MAIIVEEERKPNHIINLIGWLAFLAAAAAGAYYVFFATAVPATVPSSGVLAQIAPFTSSPVQPQSLENNPVLNSFHTTIAAPTPQGPVAVGRANPFLAP